MESRSEVSNIGLDVMSRAMPDLHSSERVSKTVKNLRKRGVTVEEKKRDRLEAFFRQLESAFEGKDEKRRQRNTEIFRRSLHDRLVIEEQNIPDNYFDNQILQAEELGYGKITISPEMRRLAYETISADQKYSLDEWIDYLNSESAPYPIWFKFWVLSGVCKLKPFNKKAGKFEKRDIHTVAMFPDRNMEVVGRIYDRMTENTGLKQVDFGQLYAQEIRNLEEGRIENKEGEIEHEWRCYTKGSPPDELVESLTGHNTGWCTAGRAVAEHQLAQGDFYVYYTRGQDERWRPRIAIRMYGGRVAEVRGVADAKQNMEPEMLGIAAEKYRNLPGGDSYEKKDRDMKTMTRVTEKMKKKQPLDLEEIAFVWEVNESVEGFGYGKDPRLAKARKQRNFEEDFGVILTAPLLSKMLSRWESEHSYRPESKIDTMSTGFEGNDRVGINTILVAIEKRGDPDCVSMMLEKAVIPDKLGKDITIRLIKLAEKCGDVFTGRHIQEILDLITIHWGSKNNGWIEKEAEREKRERFGVKEEKIKEVLIKINERCGGEVFRSELGVNTVTNKVQHLAKSKKAIEVTDSEVVHLRRVLRRNPQVAADLLKVLPITRKRSENDGRKTPIDELIILAERQDDLMLVGKHLSLFLKRPFLLEYLSGKKFDVARVIENEDWGGNEIGVEVRNVLGLGLRFEREKAVEMVGEILEKRQRIYETLKREMTIQSSPPVLFGEVKVSVQQKKSEMYGWEYLCITLKKKSGGSDFHPWSVGINERGELIYAVSGKKGKKMLRGSMPGTWNGVDVTQVLEAMLKEPDDRVAELEEAFELYLFGEPSFLYQQV